MFVFVALYCSQAFVPPFDDQLEQLFEGFYHFYMSLDNVDIYSFVQLFGLRRKNFDISPKKGFASETHCIESNTKWIWKATLASLGEPFWIAFGRDHYFQTPSWLKQEKEILASITERQWKLQAIKVYNMKESTLRKLILVGEFGPLILPLQQAINDIHKHYDWALYNCHPILQSEFDKLCFGGVENNEVAYGRRIGLLTYPSLWLQWTRKCFNEMRAKGQDYIHTPFVPWKNEILKKIKNRTFDLTPLCTDYINVLKARIRVNWKQNKYILDYDRIVEDPPLLMDSELIDDDDWMEDVQVLSDIIAPSNCCITRDMFRMDPNRMDIPKYQSMEQSFNFDLFLKPFALPLYYLTESYFAPNEQALRKSVDPQLSETDSDYKFIKKECLFAVLWYTNMDFIFQSIKQFYVGGGQSVEPYHLAQRYSFLYHDWKYHINRLKWSKLVSRILHIVNMRRATNCFGIPRLFTVPRNRKFRLCRWRE